MRDETSRSLFGSALLKGTYKKARKYSLKDYKIRKKRANDEKRFVFSVFMV